MKFSLFFIDFYRLFQDEEEVNELGEGKGIGIDVQDKSNGQSKYNTSVCIFIDKRNDNIGEWICKRVMGKE